MKALVKTKGEMGLWLEEVEKPVPGFGEVVIQVQKSAICGTDLHLYKYDAWAKNNLKLPTIIGHEFMGVVSAIGDGVSRCQRGDRVTAEGHITCGNCRACLTGSRHLCPQTVGIGIHRNGAFAEYILVPQENIVKLPDDVPDEIGAIMDPFGNAVHTALEFDLAGKSVLITGAGPIGCMAAAIAKKSGAKYVVNTDLSERRLELALKMGATHIVNIQERKVRDLMQELNIQEGFDVGLEMAGTAKTFAQVVQRLRPGGDVSLLGIYSEPFVVDMNEVLFKCLSIKGIYGRKIFKTWFEMFDFLKGGLDISPVITHRFPYTQFETAFELLLKGEASKVILDWKPST